MADSNLIAGASQFVDDAQIYKPLKLWLTNGLADINNSGRIVGVNASARGKQIEVKLNPICTAYKGLSQLWAFKPAAQKKLYVSFHFVPYQEPDPSESKIFIVKPNSKIVQNLISQAVIKHCHCRDEYEHAESLVQLGIALHSYADTWAHSGFSGLHDPYINDVSSIQTYENGQWYSFSRLKHAGMNILPDIGHAEALDLPDRPNLRWRYRKAVSGQLIEKNNPNVFIDASAHIFDILTAVSGKHRTFDKTKRLLEKAFSVSKTAVEEYRVYGMLDLHRFYEEHYQIDLHYRSEDWQIQDVDFQGDVDQLKWLFFHMAAYRQRNFVLSKFSGYFNTRKLWLRYLRALLHKAL